MEKEFEIKVKRALEKCWSEKTSVCFNPEIAPVSYGQCAPTAIVVFENFGGEILKTYIEKHDGSKIRHFYNRVDGKVLDFTAEQFEIPNYWRLSKFDDTLSSVQEALTEMLPGQIEEMRKQFKQAWEEASKG